MATPDMQASTPKGKPSQSLLPIAEIRDGVVVLKNGGMRAVLMVSSVNFALKSEDEQNALVYAYQDFLNSLDFSVQVIISSRKADISPYLGIVEEQRQKQKNELLRLQMGEYITFIRELVKNGNIMSKTFYVVVPFAIQTSKKEGFLSKFLSGFRIATTGHTLSDDEFTHNKAQLFQRVEQVAVGLRSLGLRLIPLDTQELIELYYTAYNPLTARTQRLRNVGQLDIQEMS